jgi:serine/threonine-protein kinase HipA
VTDWRAMARSKVVGLKTHELDDFAAAFEHDQMAAAREKLKE